MNDLTNYTTTNTTNTAITNPKVQTDIFANDLTGLGDMSIGSPGNLVIVQNTTRDPMGAKPGQLLDTKTGAVYDEITLVPLHRTDTRALFPQELGADPLCRSDNGIYPSQSLQTPPKASNCGDCRFSRWGEGNTKPPCALRIRLMVVEHEGVIPLYFSVGGAGYGLCRDMLQGIKQHIIKQHATTGELFQLFDFKFTVRAERSSNSRGVFYSPRFSAVTRMTPAGQYRDLFDNYVVNGLLKSQRHTTVDQLVSGISAAAEPLPAVTLTPTVVI